MKITVEYFDKHTTMGRIATYKVTTVWLNADIETIAAHYGVEVEE